MSENIYLTFRVTPAVKRRVLEHAASIGLDMSSYLRLVTINAIEGRSEIKA